MLVDIIALPDEARVWIYQSNEAFKDAEKEEVRDLLRKFSSNWVSHGHPVSSYVNLFHKHFLVFLAVEKQSNVSGCSIDGSVNFVKQIGSNYNKDLFDRMTFSYIDESENVKLIHSSQMSQAYANSSITDETLFFDNLVKTKKEFIDSWLKPLKDSWHKRFI